jgi:predicted O-linked N-acetylglucosamine transferase (SPINDLY family)
MATRKDRRAQSAKQKKSKNIAAPEQVQKAITVALGLHQSGNLAAASELYQKIIEVAPNNPDTLHLLGVLSYQKGKFEQAVNMIEKAIALSPKSAYYSNLGNAQIGLGAHEQAVASFEKSLELSPANTNTINNIGAALHELGRWEEEIAYYKQGITINPNDSGLLNELVKTMRDSCLWDGLDEYIATLIAKTKLALVQENLPPITPYHALTLPLPPIFKKHIAEHYAHLKFGHIKPAYSHPQRSRANDKLRIGYVSADYRNHPTAHLITQLFALHNRDEFEVFAYSLGKNDESIFRHKIEQNVDNFIDVCGQSDSEIATRINSDKIDILVDVMGYIQNARPAIFALRPAPLQISYLAYPGTMGTEFIDYLITDNVAVPQSDAANYSEKLIYLPNSYFITDNTQEIATAPTRESCGLPEDKFIFCSFNKSNKIDAEVFSIWMEILRQTDSVLWLFSDNDFTRKNLWAEAAKQGIAKERIIFAGRLPKAEHLGRMQLADLFLDCFTVNAHTTAIDSLWAGVPVITKVGNDIISRASASILTAAGFPQLIANDVAEYKTLALQYASDKASLAGVKKQLAMRKSALFDTAGYVKGFEDAVRKVRK